MTFVKCSSCHRLAPRHALSCSRCGAELRGTGQLVLASFTAWAVIAVICAAWWFV